MSCPVMMCLRVVVMSTLPFGCTQAQSICSGSSNMRQVLYLLPAWVICTFISSLAGGKYVRATHDCLTPATLTQAFGSVFYLLKRQRVQPHSRSGQLECSQVLVLAALQLLSIILTLGSFGISSVSHTYMLRTLEPVFSLLLMFLVLGKRASLREMVLVCSVVFSMGCVLYKPTDNDIAAGSLHTTAAESWQGGPFSPRVVHKEL